MKHFLDTSVLRPLISSTKKYKKYYKEELSGTMYICDYIYMEFIKSFIRPIINFSFLLSCPNIETLGDAYHLWSHKFNTREIKVMMNFIADLLNNRNVDKNKLSDKENIEKVLFYIDDYIQRILLFIPYKFKNTGNDNTRCTKVNFVKEINYENLKDSLKDFNEKFNDKNNFKECNVYNMMLNKKKNIIDNIMQNGDLKILNSDPKGFIKIVKEIKNISEKISCAKCSKLGDLIIAILCPSDMRLEHTDYSFDYLMSILEKTHKRHPSEASTVK